MSIPHFTAKTLAGITQIQHGFFTRHGGVSEGIYQSLNGGFGSKDKKDAVLMNRQKIREFFDANHFITLHQCHSANVITITPALIQAHQLPGAPWCFNHQNLWADSMVTNVEKSLLTILTADCAPILLADKKQPIIGACHAGWRGVVGSVIETTIAAMQQLGATKITAAIGPLIAPTSYEVGEDMKIKVLSHLGRDAEKFFQPKLTNSAKKFYFDLPGICLEKLFQAGVENAEWIRQDTYSNHDFFSYRRNSQQGIKDYGRLMSCIMIKI